MPDYWSPKNETDLLAAAKNGLLTEGGTGLEFKQELSSGESANKELARDLASLAVAGGTLIIGITDENQRNDDPASSLHPIRTQGIPERIEQIASMRCDPPLMVTCEVIPSESSGASEMGYVTVHVPASPQAPHMVDGRYWGRGDRTKRQLSDAEIVALHAERTQLDRNAETALTEYVSRDPWIEAGRAQGSAHLFVVVEPRPGRTQMLLDAIDGADWRQCMHDLVSDSLRNGPPVAGWRPMISDATHAVRRADGWALTTFDMSSGRQLLDDRSRETGLLEIELSEGGTIRLFCGRASDATPARQREGGAQQFFEKLVAGLTWQTMRLAAQVSEKTNYAGQWAIGIGMTGLRGSVSWELIEGFGDPSPYPNADYREFARSTSTELINQPGKVTDRLVGRVLRSFGVYERSTWDAFLGRQATDGDSAL